MKKYLVPFLVLLLLSVCSCQNEAPPPHEGVPAPDFVLTDLAGGNVRLSDLRGKVVLLNFWASWCPPCREEIPSLVTLNGAMSGKNFRMLAVSIDKGGNVTIPRFFVKLGVSLPTLLDPDGSVSKRYGVTGVPETFVIDGKGIIRKKVVGPIDWSDRQVILYLESLMVN